MAVKPGDQIFCSVHYVTSSTGVTYGIVNFANDSEPEAAYSIMLPTPMGFTLGEGGTSAEWIMECTNGGYPYGFALPRFSPVVFKQSFCCVPDCTLGNPVNADTYTVPTGSPQVTAVALARRWSGRICIAQCRQRKIQRDGICQWWRWWH